MTRHMQAQRLKKQRERQERLEAEEAVRIEVFADLLLSNSSFLALKSSKL